MKKNISIFIGSVILAGGLYFFLLQHHIAAGGMSGLSLVISTIFGIDIGIINLALNALVLVMGWIFISPNFAKRSVLSAVVISVSIIILENLFPDTILTNDMIINTVFGPVFIALGLGIIFYNGGSSGGTDVIASIVNKYLKVSIPASLFMTDLTVILLSMLVIGLEPSLYAILAIIVQSIALNNMIQGLGRKIALVVISDKYEEINEVLTTKFNRGVTLLHAQGGYTGREKKLVLTISTIRRYPIIQEEILKIDDKAFIFTYIISEVVGEGFTMKELG